MKISGKDIKKMVMECVSLLTEASISDVYTRYYADKIPNEIWDLLASGTTNITPFHRLIADSVAKEIAKSRDGHNSEEIREEAKDYALKIAKRAGKAWNTSETARQFLTNSAKGGFYKYKTTQNLLHFLRQVCLSTKFSEAEFIGNGLYKLYENADMLVTTTLSYSASHHYYGDSHWCTASDIYGDNNGFDMFKSYTNYDDSDDDDVEMDLLVQFVDKNEREGSYQMQTNGPYDSAQICDFFDNGAEFSDIENHFGADEVYKAIEVMREHFSDLTGITRSYVSTEDNYYNFREYRFVATRIGPIKAKTQTPEFIRYMEKCFLESLKDNSGSCSIFRFYRSKTARYIYQGGVRELVQVSIRPSWDEENTIFTKEEDTVIERASRLSTSEFSDVGRFIALFDVKGRDSAKFINRFGHGCIEGARGCIAELTITDESETWKSRYINVANGNVLLDINPDEFSLFYPERLQDGNLDAYYIGHWMVNEDFNVRFYLDGTTGTCTRVNKILRRINPRSWSNIKYYEVS